MSAAVASRYARALADLVLKPGAETDARTAVAQLTAFEQLLAASPELRNILLNPAVAPARKRAVIARFGQRLALSRLVRNFLWVLADHRRIARLEMVRKALETLLDERLGVVRAEVASARELSEAQRGALGSQLNRLTGRQARCEFSVDPALLGGAVARIGSTVYDGSLRGQLLALRRRLSGEPG